ncbi:hypothetical protein [Sporomusa aerivorans]|uniref:hypothetical protein n=1 Tax=Sporomusa aerivorans TaxID=204936 RepID=UPI00352A6F28
METKIIKPIQVLCATEYLTIQEIGERGEKLCTNIIEEIDKCRLSIVGPWTFVSYGRDGNYDTRFKHEYCVPVENIENYKGIFQIKTLQEAECAFIIYQGDLSEENFGGKGYGPLVDSIIKSGKNFTGESREVYHKWVSPKSQDNIIEIQFGIR